MYVGTVGYTMTLDQFICVYTIYNVLIPCCDIINIHVITFWGTRWFWVFGSLDFLAPRWIKHDKEDKFSCTRWILGIFLANSLDF
jgi:hypothetical protein